MFHKKASTHLHSSDLGTSKESLSKNPTTSKTPLLKILPRLIGFSKPHFGTLALGTFALMLSSAINLLFPWLIKIFLNEEWGLSIQSNLNYIAAILVALFAFQSLCFYFRHLFFHSAGYRVVSEVRNKLYAAMLSQDSSFFDQSRVGDLLSRLSSDTQLLQRAVTINVSVALRYALQVVGGIALMLYLSVKLTLCIIVVIPLFVFSGIFWGKKLRTLSRAMQDRLGEASVVADESLSHIKPVKNFVGESYELNRYAESIDLALESGLKRANFGAIFSSSMVFVMHSAIVFVLWFGSQLVFNSELSLGDLTAFILYGSIVAVSFGFLVGVWDDFMQALGASERIFSILDRKPLVQSPSNPSPLPQIAENHITFDSVSFRYPARPEVKVLFDLSFSVKPGETLAIVGPSGAGKSTIVSLLSRFYDPSEGLVKFMGVDLKELSLKDLREQISTVEQSPAVFSVSIKDNIGYGNSQASDDQIAKAASAANLDSLINKLPEGIDTLVGDKGIQLSGGEKQRIAIARALLKNAPLLILDEATSSLDSENEKLVQEALSRLMTGKTSIIIAHRLSTVKHADRVLVLKDGAICQLGTHDSLLETEGLYKNLVDLQFIA